MATSKCIMLANAMARLSVELRAVEELQHRFPLSPDGESAFAEKIREIKEEISYFDTLLYENHCFGSKEQPSKAKEGRST